MIFVRQAWLASKRRRRCGASLSPGADGTTTATYSTGKIVALNRTPDHTLLDLGHAGDSAAFAVDQGRMDRFDLLPGEASVTTEGHVSVEPSHVGPPGQRLGRHMQDPVDLARAEVVTLILA